MKMTFGYFHFRKWMLQLERKKVDRKKVFICLFFILISWIMVLKLSKKVHLLQLFDDFSYKPKSAYAIYTYASESSHYNLSENGMVYRVLSQRS